MVRDEPSVIQALINSLDAGATGITLPLLPEWTERQIMDVLDATNALEPLRDRVALSLVGAPNPALIEGVLEFCPHQFTLVPEQGPNSTPASELAALVRTLDDRGVRVSVAVDPDPERIEWAASIGAQRVELCTARFALAHAQGRGAASFADYARAAEVTHDAGLEVEARGDLNMDNLVLFRTLPYLRAVSIGHALISRALFVGLGTAVREYMDVLAATPS